MKLPSTAAIILTLGSQSVAAVELPDPLTLWQQKYEMLSKQPGAVFRHRCVASRAVCEDTLAAEVGKDLMSVELVTDMVDGSKSHYSCVIKPPYDKRVCIEHKSFDYTLSLYNNATKAFDLVKVGNIGKASEAELELLK